MRRPLCFFCLAALMLIGWFAKIMAAGPFYDPAAADSLQGYHAVIGGVVTALETMPAEAGEAGPQREGTGAASFRPVTYRLTLEEARFEKTGQRIAGKVLCYPAGVLSLLPQPGDRVFLAGNCRLFREPTNEGEFDSALYYRAAGYVFSVNEGETVRIEEGRRLVWLIPRLLFRLRIKLGGCLDACCGTAAAGPLRAVLLGERLMMEEEQKELFRDSGIAHILVISGMHISLLGMGLEKILRRAGLPAIPRTAACTAAMIFYGMLTGMGSSTVRALVMFSLRLAAGAAGRTYDAVTAIALAGLLLAAFSPLLLLQSGFLFSFGAVAGIALLSDAFPGRLSFAAVFAMTLPVHLWFYYEYPVCGIALNLLVVPLMPALVISGGAAAVLGLWSVPAGRMAGVPAALILRLYGILAGTALKLPFSTVITGRPAGIRVAVYYAVLLGTAAAAAHRAREKTEKSRFYRSGLFRAAGRAAEAVRAWPVPAVLPLAVLLLTVRAPRGMELCFLDVGQGDGIYAESPDLCFLVDGGSSSRQDLGEDVLEPFLKCRGVRRLDFILITHEDSDHCSGAAALLEHAGKPGGIGIGALLLPRIAEASRGGRYRRMEALAASAGIPVRYYARGDRIEAGRTALACLHPEPLGSYSDSNAGSGVFLLRFRNFSALLTGDVEKDGEERLIKSMETPLKVTVLKAAHHGAAGASGSAFLEKTDARWAVISCGRGNIYGHPAAETVERLRQDGMRVLDTRLCGEILFRTDGERVLLRTFLGEEGAAQASFP